MLNEAPSVSSYHESGELEEDPAALLTAALESDEITDLELEAVDSALDSMMGTSNHEAEPLISLEEAQAKLDPEILKVLAEKFKGSLTQVRHLDEGDMMF